MPTRAEIIREFVPNSPLAILLGIELVGLEPDAAELRLPFKPELATMGDTVHGGALAALLDTAVTVAAWSHDEEPESLAGATVSLHIDYVAAARGKDLIARARLTKRGRRLCFVRAEASEPEGRVVATAQGTYQLG